MASFYAILTLLSALGVLSSVIVAFMFIIWPRPAKTCLWAYADSEGPYQPVQPRSLIRAFTVL